jgi:hypothetical protein
MDQIIPNLWIGGFPSVKRLRINVCNIQSILSVVTGKMKFPEVRSLVFTQFWPSLMVHSLSFVSRSPYVTKKTRTRWSTSYHPSPSSRASSIRAGASWCIVKLESARLSHPLCIACSDVFIPQAAARRSWRRTLCTLEVWIAMLRWLLSERRGPALSRSI